MPGWNIVHSDYLKYRCKTRGFNLSIIDDIIKHSEERFFDTESGRNMMVGRHKKTLVIIPYDENESTICPITVHAISRQQIKFRLTTGRFVNE